MPRQLLAQKKNGSLTIKEGIKEDGMGIMMIENGGKEPIFNIDKITAFEVTSYSALDDTDLQGDNEDFPKIFPKMFPKIFTKLIPSCFQGSEVKNIEIILKSLNEPKSAKELASIMSCSTRTLKDKYLDKMLQAEVIVMLSC